ncbi:probable carbohydrate esterase At4g34215 [Durio zibethinus]|uniref:Probable carbohydrate esterase At4g34215 n=1 Tax=Durio zibethinus TaxID=66656 RepID=A0A6P6ANT3_DURZI|nr:probable carbohydrate esterase At4g34215 [Durio zibethinus]
MLVLAHSILVVGDSPAQDIFILAGQSKMAGRGGIANGKWDGIVPPECQPNPWILRLTANLTWEEARDPFHADIDVGRICGVGPGMAFANEILTHGSGIGGGGGTIRAILRYQGESDASTKENAETYKGKLEKLILDFRSDLNLPFSCINIQVALASGSGEFVETVRKAQMEMKLPNVKCVDAKGLALKADHLHLTTIPEAKVG